MKQKALIRYPLAAQMGQKVQSYFGFQMRPIISEDVRQPCSEFWTLLLRAWKKWFKLSMLLRVKSFTKRRRSLWSVDCILLKVLYVKFSSILSIGEVWGCINLIKTAIRISCIVYPIFRRFQGTAWNFRGEM